MICRRQLLNSIKYELSKRWFASSFHRNEVRVRFAPSPTGNLHLGGMRTALINYLYAKKYDGKYVLRIEDTDQDRVVAESASSLERILTSIGIIPDESPLVGGDSGPYYQSQRKGLYQNYVDKLVEDEHAYRCFCSQTRLELLRKESLKNRQTFKYDNRCRHLTKEEVEHKISSSHPYVVRFKLHENDVNFHDLFYGDVSINLSKSEGDPIILKSDGWPTYHLANVVDDHLMNISHVIRGIEWQTSTPKHLMLYDAFGWSPPIYAHLPLITNPDRTKLSKRQGNLGVEFLLDEGYLPEALISYVMTLGGGFGKYTKDSIYTIHELASNIDFSRLDVNPAIFSIERLQLFNRLAIKKRLTTPSERCNLINEVRQGLVHLGLTDDESLDDSYIQAVLDTYSDRISTIKQLFTDNMYLWRVPTLELNHNDMDSFPKSTLISKTLDILMGSKKDDSLLMHEVQSVIKDEGMPYAKSMKFLRLCITGHPTGPAIGQLLLVLGRKRFIERLQRALSYVNADIKC